ncbi:protein of unknown function (DUF397) [Saccharomonospora marina XMU15]|uniref:DUF397 domain-containing protein n=2 Tax=Saccharomonospora TaxID=1851 RepID=H5XBE9_9PSEU|nr:protein of unknown function (DUF397) [Saccharomonospora marina XMU15]
MTDMELSGLTWRKSSYSGGGNDCVEVAFTGDGAALRDSKNPTAGALAVPAAEWDVLLEAARAGVLNPH